MRDKNETCEETNWQRSHTEANPQKGEDNYQFLFGNQKLTYDNALEILAAQARRSQDHYDSLMVQERAHVAEIQKISVQCLQNAVESANFRGKDAIRHSQIATDQQWNMEPQEAAGESAVLREVLNQPAMQALQAAIVQAVVEGFNKVKSE